MIKTRDITGSSVVTGYEHKVSTQYTLPPPNTVDVRAELAGLREFVSKLNLPDRGKLNRAIEDATEETNKTDPDKEECEYARNCDPAPKPHSALMLLRKLRM